MENMTTTEVARRWGWTTRYITKLINAGRLAAIKFGRDWAIPRDAVLDFERSNGVTPLWKQK